MLKCLQVLWPSFMVAALAEMVFFIVIDPQELFLFGKPVHYSPLTTYSVGFFCFWLICAASSLTTIFLQRSAAELNHHSEMT